MTLDNVYTLVIYHLVSRYPVSLEHYDLPVYRANPIKKRALRMTIVIYGHDVANLKWDDSDWGSVNGWDHTEVFDKYDF